MLTRLNIKNFTLIDSLDIEFHGGFSVVTGETGAGKSIIIGALGLLLGNRADVRQVKKGCAKCVVEATFNIGIYDNDTLNNFFADNDLDSDGQECVIRREVSVTGKSRAFVNDTPVTLGVMRELGEMLIDVHSQHQNLLLNKEDFQLTVVDIIARDKAQLAEYKECYAEYRRQLSRLEHLRGEQEKNRDNEDFLRFQRDELAQAALADGEQEELEEKAEMMSHAEEIKRVLHESHQCLSDDDEGVVARVRTAAARLQSISSVYSGAGEMSTRLDACFVELKDISSEIASGMDDVEYDPVEFDAITRRLDTIYSLQQKYRVTTVAELMAKQQELDLQLDDMDNYDERLTECERQVATLCEQCRERAAVLSSLRAKAALEVERDLHELLVPLGLPNVRFKVDMQPQQLTTTGSDKIQFLFSANTSTDMQPVAQVASGGEIARVMLSLKAMISKAIGLPTIVFDEIDTGVSGRVAEQMAKIMSEMGHSNRQVICITHLPQIAACGTTHYKVRKYESDNGTVSTMVMLNDKERVGEIAQMLSGSDVTQAAIDNAEALLGNVLHK